MMTKRELHDEFWLLTKSILQDSRIDFDETKVLKRWLEEHQRENLFDVEIDKLNGFLANGYIGRIEAPAVIDIIGNVIARLK